MKLNQRICSILVLTFSAVTITLAVLYFLKLADINMIIIFLGFTSLFIGLYLNCIPPQVNQKGICKYNKKIGAISAAAGIVIIIADIVKSVVPLIYYM